MSFNAPPPAQVHVLLIEDNEADGLVFRRALEREREHGFRVEQVFTLIEGLSALELRPPDCVVLDLGLPDSSGLGGLGQVLALDVAPVIVMTGDGSDRLALDALRMGAQDYLVKEVRASPRTVHAVRYAIERRASVEALREAERQAAQRRVEFELELAERRRLEALGVLTGGVAHDFNNLAGVILGNADFLLAHLDPGSDQHEAAIEVRTAALRSAALTQQMLAYSGDGRHVVERVKLAEVVSDLAGPARGSIPGNVTVELELAPSTPSVAADVRQLDQVVFNLMANAAEAMDGEPGTIRVCTRGVELSRTGLDAYRAGDHLPEGRYAELEVSDTGSGIAPDALTKIFDPFFTTRFDGRGLGLAAVDGIVRGHGGGVRVHSEPGAGSAFNLVFPEAA